MASNVQPELVQEGVFIHTSTVDSDEDVFLPGRICIWNKSEGVFLEWKAVDELTAKDTEWTMVSSETAAVSFTKTNSQSDRVLCATKRQPDINFDIKDLRTFHRSKPSTGWSYLVFILRCGTTHPALHFHHGGTKNVIQALRKHLHIKTSPHDSCLYIVTDHDPQALHKSFDELQLFEGDQAGHIISKFMQDPYSATLGGFSKVTHFLRDTLLASDQPDDDLLTELTSSQAAAAAAAAAADINTLAVNSMAEAGFELVTARELPPLPHVIRSLPVTSELWSSYMDSEGRITDVDDVKDAIFRGGVESSVRTEVWKFLLGYYDWTSTYKSRSEQRRQKVDDYFRMKLQWKSMTPDQESRFSELRDRRSLIEKDVARTDRTHSFFEGENNANINVLYDILLTHCMYDFDLGYVQGMSDLLAPILVVMENEVDAFWCFAGFVRLVGSNFEKDQQSMKRQLQQLQLLLSFLDPELANYLDSQESSNMYFCFRWLLILFKREFSFPDIMRLWEVVWTGRPCTNFHLLLCVAVLMTEKTTLMESNFGFTEILKHINDMSGTLLVDDMLTLAEALYLQLCACRDLPSDIHDILSVTVPRCADSHNNNNNNNAASAGSVHTAAAVQHSAVSAAGTLDYNQQTLHSAVTSSDSNSVATDSASPPTLSVSGDSSIEILAPTI